MKYFAENGEELSEMVTWLTVKMTGEYYPDGREIPGFEEVPITRQECIERMNAMRQRLSST